MKIFVLLTLIFLSLVRAQNQTRAQFRQRFQPQDFIFDIVNKPKDSIGLGGEIKLVTAVELPALSEEGVSLVLVSLEPCSTKKFLKLTI